MSSLLAVDIGNTNVKYGHFVDGEMIKSWRHELAATAERAPAIIGQVDAPVVLASVVPTVAQQIADACRKLGRTVFSINSRSQELITGMNDTMGADRVVDAVAAYKLYAMCKRPVLVFGFGTATTLLAVTASGHVAGGWIAPGLLPTLEVLHDRCALLPLLKMEGQTEALGFDTASHMRNGVFLAHVGLVKQWIEVGRRHIASGDDGDQLRPVCVATGGWAQTIEDYAHVFDIVDQQLTLKGAYLVGEAAGVGVQATESQTNTASEQ